MTHPEATPTFDRVILDYGHGGMIKGEYQTNGKQYHFNDQGVKTFSVYEGVINRKVAAAMIHLLLPTGITVLDAVKRRPVLSLDYTIEQRDISLRDRIRFVNAFPGRGTLLVSLHGNAIGNSSIGPSLGARGICFYTSKGQTLSDSIATSVFDSFSAHPGIDIPIRRGDLSDGDPDHEADFYVLKHSKCAAMLGEVGLFTNIVDARWMLSPEGVQATAEAYFNGLRPWLNELKPLA